MLLGSIALLLALLTPAAAIRTSDYFNCTVPPPTRTGTWLIRAITGIGSNLLLLQQYSAVNNSMPANLQLIDPSNHCKVLSSLQLPNACDSAYVLPVNENAATILCSQQFVTPARWMATIVVGNSKKNQLSVLWESTVNASYFEGATTDGMGNVYFAVTSGRMRLWEMYRYAPLTGITYKLMTYKCALFSQHNALFSNPTLQQQLETAILSSASPPMAVHLYLTSTHLATPLTVHPPTSPPTMQAPAKR